MLSKYGRRSEDRNIADSGNGRAGNEQAFEVSGGRESTTQDARDSATQSGRDFTRQHEKDSRQDERNPTTQDEMYYTNYGETREDTARMGSPGSQGEMSHKVGLAQGNGVAGFFGRASEMSWMQRAFEYLKHPSPGAHGAMPGEDAEVKVRVAEAFAYFLDETALLSINEDAINPLTCPRFDIALVLTEAAFHSMYGLLDFLDREQFLQALLRFPRLDALPSWTERRWLATANLVWAIGARWFILTAQGLPHTGHIDSHLAYYARSRALGLDHRVVYDHPDLQQIQAMGLLAFFLLLNNSISR